MTYHRLNIHSEKVKFINQSMRLVHQLCCYQRTENSNQGGIRKGRISYKGDRVLKLIIVRNKFGVDFNMTRDNFCIENLNITKILRFS